MAMRMVRWDPFREIASLQNELNRALGAFRETDAGATQGWVPAVDVWETDDDVVYAFDLPGVSEEKISLELEDNALTVTAERERQQEVSEDRYYRYERRVGTFARTIALPQGVNEDQINAEYTNGVLEVRVPKPQAPEPRRIQVGSGSGSQATIEGEAKTKES